jgi:hypothetical protein
MKGPHLRHGFALLAGAMLLAGAAGCYDDTCDPACRDGYACYYGICLSRGYCPEGSANSERHCVEYNERGDCVDWRGLCVEGYSCECTFLAGDGSCDRRECVTIEDGWYPTEGD